MANQNPAALALQALSSIEDMPADGAQPLWDGIHLRWFIGTERDFPAKGGFYVLRRRVGAAPTCLMPLLQPQVPAVVAKSSSLPTAIGTLSELNGPVPALPFGVATPGITGFYINDVGGLQFSLPAGVLASQFTVRVQIPTGLPVAPAVTITGSVGANVYYKEGPVTAVNGPVLTVTANPSQPVNTIQITGFPKGAILLDLCYVKAPVQVGTPIAAPAAVLAPPQNPWELIPGLMPLTKAITLPLQHPSYAANPGSESIATSLAIAQSRMIYGYWATAFRLGKKDPAPGPASGKVTLTNGSALATFTGTTWDNSLIGKLICVPAGGTDYAAYAVMAVPSPTCAVLSRPFSGATLSAVAYDALTGDDFADFVDRIASLMQPGGMRSAVSPPVLDPGIAAGRSVVINGDSNAVTGIGTQWTASLIGCDIEIGPSSSWGAYFTGTATYRIVTVPSSTQLTLDRPFVGSAGLPAVCGYQIVARANGDKLDATSPFLQFAPMDLVELASLAPSYAQALGLYWIDTSVFPGDVFDYIVIADRDDKFAHQAVNAMNWMNAGSPDFSSDALDGYMVSAVKHSGSPPLAAPAATLAFTLPCAGARITMANPNRASSDVGISVTDAATWSDPKTPQPAPVMMNLWRLPQGAGLAPDTTMKAYQDAGMMIPSISTLPPNQVRTVPDGWPPAQYPIHYMDSGTDGTGLAVGWYGYYANNIDIFGRWSAKSAQIPSTVVKGLPNAYTTANANADGDPSVHLQDLIAPPPPSGVRAWMLDDNDPNLVRDPAFGAWRSNFPVLPTVVGLRVRWTWPWAFQNQGPDLRRFLIYALSSPLNARTGTVTSVAAGSAGQSVVTLNIAADAFTGASLQVASRSFPILGSAGTTSVQLTVQNGGANKDEPPASNVAGAIVIPNGHALAKDLLDPRNWQWLAAVPQDLASTTFDVQMVEDPSIVTFDNPANNFSGVTATWDGTSTFVLDAYPGTYTAASVRPGIDALALTSPTASFMLQINSASNLQIVPASLPSPLPLAGTQFQWQIGPSATWDGTAFQLKGIPAVVRPGIDVLALTSATESFVVDIQSVSGSQIVPVTTSLPNPAPPAGTPFQWQLGPGSRGLQGLTATWNSTNNTLTLDGKNDLSYVHVGTDLVYVAVAGATPKGLNFFLPIAAVGANSLVLSGTPAQLSALTPGPWAWKIGQPFRQYEVFLPAPPGSPVIPATGLDISKLIPPSWPQPVVVHGMVGVSSADWRDDIPDQATPSRGLFGNEGKLAATPVYRVWLDPVKPPVSVWKTPLIATKANYKSESYFTVRWNNPGPGYYTHVLRAMDSAIFLELWKLNPATSLPTTGAPTAIAAFLTAFAALQTPSQYQAALTLWATLDDASLTWLAAQDALADAYKQITITPLDVGDHANADRVGPDDTLPHALNPNGCAYLDTLPGRSTNRYFYRLMFLDGAQNRSLLGPASPPVHIPKVAPPRTPVITAILGGDRQITIQWASNREPDLAGYQVYRAASQESAGDLRSMSLMGQPTKTQTAYIDTSCPASTDLYYRMVAVDTAGNVSRPSTAVLSRAFDVTPPVPATWQSAGPVKVDTHGLTHPQSDTVVPFTQAIALL